MVAYTAPSCPQRPAWLDSLLTAKFFTACQRHSAAKKNERNIFNVDTSETICQHCLPPFSSPQKLLQIRRYVYHDVVRLQDITKLLDCSGVQTYIINSARVVFLNQRPQPKPAKVSGNICETCDRTLQDTYNYCSVCCKVDAVLKRCCDMGPLIPRCSSPFSSPICPSSPPPTKSHKRSRGSLNNLPYDDEEDSPDSNVEDPTGTRTSSDSTANEVMGPTSSLATFASTATKKVRSSRSLPNMVVLHSLQKCASEFQYISCSMSSRRKGTPTRSPIA